MDLPKYRLSKLYIYTTIASLLILSGYYYHRFLKYYDEGFVYKFNFFSLIIFLASITLLILLFYNYPIKNKLTFLLLFFLLTFSTILSHDFITPYVCADCKMNSQVGKRFREQGLVSFLKNYHKPTLYKFKKSPQLYEKFLRYDNKLKFSYKKLLDNIENETSDITVISEGINFRIGKHSPLWFCIIGLWQTFFSDSYFLQIIMPANIIAILYLISLYFFLGLFYKRKEYKDKLFILFVILLLPVFLTQAAQTTNDLILGILVIWVFFFLLKNTKQGVDYKDLSAGFLYSLAVLFKFTSLTLMLPIALLYLIRFKARAIPKLLVFLSCFSVFPILLYTIFEYDMILNIITGSIEEFTLKASRGRTIIEILYWDVLLELYNFGIPVILFLITHMLKIRKYLALNEVLTSYLFIAWFFILCFFFWGGGISRHWLGFIPLIIPLLVYTYNNCADKNKIFVSISILLILNNILILLHEGIIMAGFYQRHFHVEYWR